MKKNDEELEKEIKNEEMVEIKIRELKIMKIREKHPAPNRKMKSQPKQKRRKLDENEVYLVCDNELIPLGCNNMPECNNLPDMHENNAHPDVCEGACSSATTILAKPSQNSPSKAAL